MDVAAVGAHFPDFDAAAHVSDFVNNGAYFGKVVRYDTQAAYGTASSWSTFDVASVDPKAKGFNGAQYDGRYQSTAANESPPHRPNGRVPPA